VQHANLWWQRQLGTDGYLSFPLYLIEHFRPQIIKRRKLLNIQGMMGY